MRTGRSKVIAVERRLWVPRLIISSATRQKLSALHGLDWHDVNEALVGVRGTRIAATDPNSGRKGRSPEALVHKRIAPCPPVWITVTTTLCKGCR